MVRVLLAEDVTIVRQGLVALLGYEPDLVVVADVGRGDEVVPAALRTGPDVAVIDIDLPGPDGLRTTAELRERLPGCRTLLLAGQLQPAELRRALAAGCPTSSGRRCRPRSWRPRPDGGPPGSGSSTRNSPWPRRGAGEPADAP